MPQYCSIVPALAIVKKGVTCLFLTILVITAVNVNNGWEMAGITLYCQFQKDAY